MFSNRSEILQHIISPHTDSDGEHICLCKKPYGNLLWSVWICGQKKYIRLDIYKFNFELGGWQYTTQYEGYFEHDNCPLGYIKQTPIIDQAWRDRVLSHHSHISLWREIRDLFTKIRKERKNEIIVLEIDCDLPSKEFILESLKPIRARNMGKLWKVRKQTIIGYRISSGTSIL